MERSFREKENENAGDNRKVMFGLIREHELNNESRQVGFIKSASIFKSQETQDNIDQLEKESKAMAANFESENTKD